MRSTHDLDLPDDTDDDAYNAHMAEWLPFLFDAYDPRLVFSRRGWTRSGKIPSGDWR